MIHCKQAGPFIFHKHQPAMPPKRIRQKESCIRDYRLTLKPGNHGEWVYGEMKPNANIDSAAFSGNAQLRQFPNAVKCAGTSQSLKLKQHFRGR